MGNHDKAALGIQFELGLAVLSVGTLSIMGNHDKAALGIQFELGLAAVGRYLVSYG